MAVDWNQATWEAMYQGKVRWPGNAQHGQVKHYTREGMTMLSAPGQDPSQFDVVPMYARRWEQLTSVFTIPQSARILIAGCGFGWLIEAAKAAGWPNVYGIDNSPYVIARKNEQSLPGKTEKSGDVVLVERGFSGGGAVLAALRNATGDDEFHWVISEDMTSSLDDTELAEMLVAAEIVLYDTEPLSQIVHLVTPIRNGLSGDSALYWRTLSEYKTFASAHTWVDVSFEEIL